jgi:nucleotide-binding universal stress UspA family protein
VSENIDPGSIVVAVDGSDHAERAVHWAAEQASLEGRRLMLVAVGEDARSIADHAASLIGSHHPGLDVRTLCRNGDPRRVLIELSAQAHLIVLGSRGRGALKSMLLGSVSAAVSAHAACPVVVCRPVHDQPRTQGVIVGADGTPESLPVIEFAYQQASLRRMPLTVLHCFWDAAAAVAEYHRARGEDYAAPDLEDLRAVLATSVAGFAETYPDVPVALELKHGLVDEALSPRTTEWDLIVVGRHPMTSVSRVLTGSIATAVLERACATVAVVPEAPRSS